MKNMCAIVAIMSVFTLAVCFIMTGSISEELKSRLDIDNSAIGTMVFIFSLTCMIVQLLVGPLVDRIGHKSLAVLGFLVAGISIFLLAFAPMFPTIVGVTFSKYDAGLYGSIFGIIFSIGLLGSMILPKLIGSLSVNKTVQQSLPITGIMAGVLLIIVLLMGRAYKRHNK